MKKTEEELLLYISRLESTLDNLPFEVWFKDVNCNYLIVNKSIEDYFGKTKDEIIGKNNFELYPEEAAKIFNESDRAALEGAELKFFELDFDNKVFEEYKKPVRDEAGKITGITGFSRNITQRKKAIDSLTRSEQNKTELLSNMPGVAFRCNNDEDYTVTFISDSCLGLTGYTSEELLSFNPSYNELIHPEYRKALKTKWDAEDDENTISTDEYPIRTKLGETKWVMEQSQRSYDENHQVIGAEGFITDITGRKLAERALKRSEERFRTMFDEAPLGMAIIDATNGEIYQVNARYAEVIGRTKRELVSSNIKDYSDPVEIDTYRNKIKQILTHQISVFSQYQQIIKPDGSAIWVNITVAPLNFDEEYSNPRLLCMLEDVTDRRNAEEEILYLSYYDQLTGIYNRRFYAEELRRVDTERNLPITLVMADVNGLKLTNDAFGHHAGDKLLKHIADMIRKQCRADDIFARIGGDEFILLLPQTDSDQAAKLVERITAAIANEDDYYPVACSVSFGWDTKKEPAEDINKIYTSAEDRMYRRKLTESATMRNDTIKLILRMLAQKYPREEQHSKRVSKLCAEIAEALGMRSDSINELRLAGYMHNIGYIGLREELVNKAGSYTDAERFEMERHPEIAYQLLRSAGKYSAIANYILYHHERPDGRGYPSRAAAADIPVEARIIAVADAFDAMTNDRQYGKKMTASEALKEIKKNAGTQFDSEIAEALEACIK
jgi:diguanylate cyclase (GGDEF)-like protein/PAS domain S-box-containing protein